MKIGIFTGATSVRSKNIFTAISRYPTGKHKIKLFITQSRVLTTLTTPFSTKFTVLSNTNFSNPGPEDRIFIFNRVITDILVALRETTLNTSDSIETGSPVECETAL